MLKLNYQSLSAVIGQGLIAAVLPAVKALNYLLSKLMQVADAFRTFMYTLMGKKFESSSRGISDYSEDIGEIEDSGDAAADGLDDATDSAEELKKALSVLPFDELNQLASAAESSGGSSGSGTSGGLDDLNFGGLSDAIDDLAKMDAEGPINEWAQRIREAFLEHDWEGLGKEIAWGINNGLQFLYDTLNWNKIGPKITEFTSAFTTTLNSLVDNINWDLMGRTVGTGINTLVNTFNQLIGPGGIDFKNIGTKLSVGLRGALDEIEWTNLGNLLGNKFMIAWDILNGFVTDMSRKNDAGLTGWAELGNSIAKAANGLFDAIDFIEIANTLTTGINGAFEALNTFTETFGWDDLVNNIQDGITEFLKTMEWKENGEAFGNFLSHLCTAIKGVMNKDTFYEIGKGLGEFLGELPWEDLLKTAGQVIIDAMAGLLKGLWDSGTIGKIAAGISGAFLAVKVLDITGISTLAGKVISHFISKMKTEKNIEKLADAIGSVISSGSTEAASAIGEVGKAAATAAGETSAFGTAVSAIAPVAAILGTVELTKKIAELGDTINGGNGKLSEFGGIIDGIKSNFLPDLNKEIFTLKEELETAGATSDEIKEKFISLFVDAGVSADTLTTAFGNVTDGAAYSAETMDIVQGIIDGVAESAENLGETAAQSAAMTEETYAKAKEELIDFAKSVGLSGDQLTILNQIMAMSYDSGSSFKDMFALVSDQLQASGVDVSGLSMSLSEDLQAALTDTAETASTSMATTANEITEKTTSAARNVSANSADIEKNIKRMSGNTEGYVSDSFTKINKSVSKNSADSEEATNTSFSNMESGTAESMEALYNSVKWHTNAAYEAITNKFQWATDNAISSFAKMASDIGNNLNSIVSQSQRSASQIVSAFSSISSQISGSFSGMYNIGRNAAISLANGISSVHIPMPHISVSSSTQRNGNGYSYSMSSSVNWYALGGLFDRASVIGVGEAGKEAVLPLENQKTMSMIADSILSGMGADDEILANAVARGVAMAMMNNQQNPINVSCYAELKTENDEVLARAVTRGQQKIDYRMNATPQYGY